MMIPRRHIKSKTKQLCCWDEFSDYLKTDIQKPLASTKVLKVEGAKKSVDDSRRNTNRG